MKKIISFCAVLVLMLCEVTALAGNIPDMKFRRFDTRDGLSSSQVNCIFKDSRGAVWIGTAYGLNRYDGYRVKTYYSNRMDSTTMRDNYVEKIYEGHDGKLWIKHGMNYSVFDPVTERFQRNIQDELVKFGLPRKGVDRIFIDKDKNYWAKLYDEGVFYYNPKSKKLTRFRYGYDFDKNEVPSHFLVSSFASLGDKVVMTSNNGDLLCLNGETGRAEWQSDWMRKHGGLENRDYHIYIDALENLWIISEPQCFIYIQKEKVWYNSAEEYLRSRGIDKLSDDLHESLQVWDLLVDENDWLWVATDHQGLFVIDMKNKEVRQFTHNKNNETTISDNTIRHLYEDDLGQVWIGFYRNGICQYRKSTNNFRSVELGEVNTVCEDRFGNYWVGTNDQGILVYNPKTDEVMQHYTKDNSGLSGNVMVGSLAASDGSIWFGSYNGGLSQCVPQEPADRGTAVIRNTRAIDELGGLANNNVWDLTEDHWHRIWFSTLGSGVQMYNPKTGKFKSWNQGNTALTNGYMTTVRWTSKGWLLVGHDDYYSIINPVTGQLINGKIPDDPDLPSSSHTTYCALEDSRGLIWQGTSSGAYVYDPKTKNVELLDMTKGLYGSSICGLLEDRDHIMWVVTDHGISRVAVQPEDDGTYAFMVLSFNSRDGLQPGTYNQRSIYQTREGLILVGGQGGLDIIDPKQIGGEKSTERPVFSGLLLGGHEVQVGERLHGRVLMEEILDVSRELHLKYSENNFTIQLGSTNASLGNSHSFVYRLDGFDEDGQWIHTSEQNPNITYMSLPIGSYTLCVRMLKDDGTPGDIESQLEIVVEPPFYRTWWAYLFYVLLLVGAYWLWHRNFLARQKRKMEIDNFRRETEKMQWMNDMRLQMNGAKSDAAADQPISKEDIHLKPTEGDIVACISRICDSFKAPDGKSAKLSFNSTVESLMMSFDKEQLTQAVNQLLKNSVRFCPHACRIQVSVFAPSDDVVKLLIADNGVGIKDEYKTHVFDHVMMEGGELGLDRVKAIVDAHEGSISVENNPGGGTVFVITLPRKYEVVEDAEMMETDDW